MNKLKLLYAENIQQIREEYILYLQNNYNFTIYEACDGLEALAIYMKYEPDIVLTELSIPSMCGLELAREIRILSQHTKIIILTANAEYDKLIEAFEVNVVNYLIKPIDIQKLKNSIDIAIETIYKQNTVDDKYIILDENTKFNIINRQYYINNIIFELPQSETLLLELLCKNKNKNMSINDIFSYVWNDFDKEFSSDSVRTLVKKLRKKLPNGILKNIYGGFYKLNI